MTSVPDFLNRAADKNGFTREKYTESKIPTSFGNLAVMLFFGDMRSEFVFSTMLYHRYLKDKNPSKYFILCSYSGHSPLYPYVNEYWGVSEPNLYDKSNGFLNEEQKVITYQQQLNRWFEDVRTADEIKKYYWQSFNQEFFDELKWIKYNLPFVPASKVELNRFLANKAGYKVFIHPVRVLRFWVNGKIHLIKIRIDFWLGLIEKLLQSGFVPVVYQNEASFDVSPKFAEQCYYCIDKKITDVLAAMRATGCVLDVFQGISRFALIARCPFLSCIERNLYVSLKEYEIDDLCGKGIPYQYMFSFPSLIESNQWHSLVDALLFHLKNFCPTINRDSFLNTSETSEVLSYSQVKKRKMKRLGARFIKVDKL